MIAQGLSRNPTDAPVRVGTRLKDRRLYACAHKTKTMSELGNATPEKSLTDSDQIRIILNDLPIVVDFLGNDLWFVLV